MTDAHYHIDCCATAVAVVEIYDGRVIIKPPAGEDLYRVAPPPRIEEPGLSDEQISYEYKARDKLHSLVMKRARGHHVSEVVWPDHSTFVVGCADCRYQIEVAPANMPRLARILTDGDWSVTGGVVPLGVLSKRM